MNYNPTPKVVFVKDAVRVAAHHKLVEDETLRESLDAALLQYQRKQAALQAPDLGGAASCFLRIQGAQEFVNEFLNLAESTVTDLRTDTVNLPGNIKDARPRV